eukprot:3305115-Karenia_brevis.AAC.1
MHRICQECAARDTVQHVTKRRQIEGGGLTIAKSPTKPDADRHRAENHMQHYENGAFVDYHSTSTNRWVHAKVLAFNNSKGLYELDCKPEVPPSRIRPRAAPTINNTRSSN